MSAQNIAFPCVFCFPALIIQMYELDGIVCLCAFFLQCFDVSMAIDSVNPGHAKLYNFIKVIACKFISAQAAHTFDGKFHNHPKDFLSVLLSLPLIEMFVCVCVCFVSLDYIVPQLERIRNRKGSTFLHANIMKFIISCLVILVFKSNLPQLCRCMCVCVWILRCSRIYFRATRKHSFKHFVTVESAWTRFHHETGL